MFETNVKRQTLSTYNIQPTLNKTLCVLRPFNFIGSDLVREHRKKIEIKLLLMIQKCPFSIHFAAFEPIFFVFSMILLVETQK